ncbi:MAG: glycosyltransferase family 4 protein [Flavobacterium sp.]|jgi:glycosyltransferase involved in cell wall biosynthesis|uniref:glycosyltransferase family 4 protein n=1 Tax=Flavobacterium sp. TaxID=239 RepID=UPI0022C37F3F|nr:glycosyltransferase family 4 protein [Flavobacterium sp.]MCZ8168357.1 glycosyltransferase family 4 protein [Flavobacterium sp.]MCZ8296685.1 glycosyltransferase family 4 protein [Flavobacterium sp.]
MQDILIISNYYPPEKGAAANRIEQMALQLHKNNYAVTVLCPLGNYPKGELFPEYRGKFSVTELQKGIRIKRLWIYPSNSKNIVKRLLSILSFSSVLVLYLLFKKTPKKVIVQSPPLLLSFLSVAILTLKRKKIILNVSDLWPLAALELNALKKESFSHNVSLFMERFIYQKASVLLGQSQEILDHVHSIFSNKQGYLYRNYPDHAEKQCELQTTAEPTIKIFYAGLLGVAQGVYELCRQLDLVGTQIELHIFGDGAEKKEIEAYLQNHPQQPIFFHGMMDRKALHEMLKTFDIAIVPLTTRIYGSVPSKIFEYGSLGFPILYFGGGEGENIVANHGLGWVVPVGDFSDMQHQLLEINALDKSELAALKTKVFEQSQMNFDIEKQVKGLIDQGVF